MGKKFQNEITSLDWNRLPARVRKMVNQYVSICIDNALTCGDLEAEETEAKKALALTLWNYGNKVTKKP